MEALEHPSWGGQMNEQDILRIVRNILSSVVDLVDSGSNEKTSSAVLFNVRNGVEGFVSLLDEVILDDTISDVEGLEDVTTEDM
jgi:hypothetical protein